MLLEWSCFSVLGSGNATISWVEPIRGIRWHISNLGLVLVKSCHNNSLLQVCNTHCSPSLPASEWASSLKFFVALTSTWLSTGYWAVLLRAFKYSAGTKETFHPPESSTWNTLSLTAMFYGPVQVTWPIYTLFAEQSQHSKKGSGNYEQVNTTHLPWDFLKKEQNFS